MPQEIFNDIITLSLGPATIYALPLPEKTERTSSRETEKRTVARIVRHLWGDENLLRHTPDGAPYIANSDQQISISHGGGYALLAVSDSQPIGIDIECYRPQLKRVAPKFLSSAELEIYRQSESLLLQAWTSKEAIFKVLGINTLTISEIILPKNPDTANFICHNRPITLYRAPLGNSMITLATINSR